MATQPFNPNPQASDQSPNQVFSGPSFNPLDAESQARQLTAASLAGYGAFPNPQAVYEGFQSGSTPSLTQAYQQGDPQFQAQLAAEPAGSTDPSLTQLPGTVNDPNAQNMYSFDWKSYWNQQHDTLGKDENAGWRSLGWTPQLNFSWMQGVEGNSSPDQIKKLQQYFAKMDPSSKIDVSGVWDDQTRKSFQQMMISYAMPTALYSKDPQEKGKANLFLQGLGFDPTSLQTKVSRDQGMQKQVIQAWMLAQGPDAESGTQSSLQHFANLYGKENLPSSYAQLEGENPAESFRNALAGAPILGLIGDIPGVGGVYHGGINLLTGNVDVSHMSDIFEDPRQQRKQKIESTNFDKYDQQALAPALQQVQDSAGYLGFFDNYDAARTKGILGLAYFFGDGLGEGKWENPFDPMSAANLGAEAHKDNLFAGLFGSDAANMPFLPGFVNFAANIVDDPISYIPLAGELNMVKDARMARTIAMATGDHMPAVYGAMRREAINTTQRQAVFAARKIAEANPDKAMVQGLHITNFHGNADELSAAMKGMNQILDPNTDFEKAMDIFQNGDAEAGIDPMAHHLPSARGLYNLHAALKSLPEVKSKALWGKIRMTGALTEEPLQGLVQDPHGVATHVEKMALATGMQAEDIYPEIHGILKAAADDPNKAIGAYQQAVDKVMNTYYEKISKNGSKDGFLSFVAKMRNGKRLGKGVGAVGDQVVNFYVADPTATTIDHAAELSLGPKWLDGDQTLQRHAIDHWNSLKDQLQGLRASGADEEDLRLAQDRLDNWQGDMMRPTPMWKSQLANEVHVPFSLSELTAYQNRALRYSESLQSHLHLDWFQNLWKKFTIGKISSALRMDIGEDVIRVSAQLTAMGHPDLAARNLFESMFKAVGVITPGVRKRVLANLENFLKDSKAAGFDLSPILQDTNKTLMNVSPHVFQPFLPSSMGYRDQLVKAIQNHWSQDPAIKAWLTDGKKGVSKYLKSDDPYAKATLESQGGHLGKGQFNAVVNRYDDYLKAMLRDNDLRQWVQSGNIDMKKLDRKIRETGAQATTTLPTIAGRADTPMSRYMFGDGNAPVSGNVLQRGAQRAKQAGYMALHPESVIEQVHVPMINAARANGAKYIKQGWENQIRRTYEGKAFADTPGFEQFVQKQANAHTIDWMRTNTYQGTRSVMGNRLRNVFPFWGATANMNKFWMSQSMATPFVGSAVLHTAVRSQEASTQQAKGGWEGILAHLGFSGGEGVAFNPMHSFFLTSDGIASFVPGTGPIFAPILQFAASHNLASFLSAIPGLGQNIDYNTGQAKPEVPWLADLISGGAMAITGNNVPLPFVAENQDRVDALVGEKIKQMERDGTQVTEQNKAQIIDQAKHEVGRQLLLQGGLSYTVPMSPSVTDVGQQDLSATMDAFRTTPDENARNALIGQQFGMNADQWKKAMADGSAIGIVEQNPNSPGAMLAYLDTRFGPEQRDIIANAAPWTVAQSQSYYQTTSGDYAQNLTQWQRLRSIGDISVLRPEDYVNKITKERDINTGWLEADKWKQADYNIRRENGWTTQDPNYQQWKQSVYEKGIEDVGAYHPEWAKLYSNEARTDMAGKYYGTRALRTLSTFEVLPQSADGESPKTILWRNALVAKDEAAQEVESLKLLHGSQAEIDNVMAGLQAKLQELAQQDPSFATELSQFSFSKWQDIVNLEAGDLQVNAGA